MQLVELNLVGQEQDLKNKPSDAFEDFWTLMWRKEAKKDARKQWLKINPALYPEIITAACAWRKVFFDRGVEYAPYPATWLHGERWEDELPVECTRTVAAHQDAVMPDLPRKSGEIPQHVREQLAKLRRA